jgi:hypothetical protein
MEQRMGQSTDTLVPDIHASRASILYHNPIFRQIRELLMDGFYHAALSPRDDSYGQN